MIEPRKGLDMDKGRALAMAPCIDLDAYFFVKVLGNHFDGVVDYGSIPAFTRKMDCLGPSMIMSIMEYGPLNINLHIDYFYEAEKKGFVIRKTPCPIWKVEGQSGALGYGRNFPEAVCKLLISKKVKK